MEYKEEKAFAFDIGGTTDATYQSKGYCLSRIYQGLTDRERIGERVQLTELSLRIIAQPTGWDGEWLEQPVIQPPPHGSDPTLASTRYAAGLILIEIFQDNAGMGTFLQNDMNPTGTMLPFYATYYNMADTGALAGNATTFYRNENRCTKLWEKQLEVQWGETYYQNKTLLPVPASQPRATENYKYAETTIVLPNITTTYTGTNNWPEKNGIWMSITVIGSARYNCGCLLKWIDKQ